MSTLKIKDDLVLGEGQPCWVVAEIGLCHNGDLATAKQMIVASARAGADVVKFQKRDVANLAIGPVLDAPDDRFPTFGSTYRQVRNHIEFDLEQYKELQQTAREAGVELFASVFDIKSASEMAALEMPLIKVASHCLSNKPLIDHLCDLGLPLLLSTGMAYWEEIDETVEALTKANIQFGLYHCVSSYPHTYETANLSLITRMKKRYGVPVGYSSHELDNQSAFLATALGAFSIEKHVTLARQQEGFDHGIAQDMAGLKDLVDGVRRAECALGNGEKSVSAEEMVTRNKYHCSVVAAQQISAGETISSSMLTTKNPGTGIAAREIDSVVGRIARQPIESDTLIAWDMLE